MKTIALAVIPALHNTILDLDPQSVPPRLHAFHMVSLQEPAHVYQQRMRDGKLSSQSLVSAFLDQIDRHNEQGLGLRAVLSACPRGIALAQASQLDEERQRGDTRSDLHGIPIMIKVSLRDP